jgi:hypothetical protein
MKKKTLGLILVLAMILTCIPVNAKTYNYDYPGFVHCQWNTYPVLRCGDDGDFVKGAQSYLSYIGYRCTADGIFGSETKSAVISFQADNGLTTDGIIGPLTWQCLNYYSK